MKSVRVLSPYIPYPADEGAFHLILNQVIYFSSVFEHVEVVSWKNPSAQFEAKVKAIQSRFQLPNVKWIDLHDHVDQKSRLARLAQATFSPWASPELHYYPELTRLPNMVDVDLEIFHYSFCVPWLDRWPKKTRAQVCVLHNIESDVYRLKVDATANPVAKRYHRRTLAKLAAHEKQLGTQLDELWCLSEVDASDFARIVGPEKIRVTTPNYDGWKSIAPRFSKPANITVGFIGGMDFQPNHDSAEFILKKIAPKLPKSGFRVVLAGKNAPEDIRALAEKFPFVEIPGFVDDIEAFWSEIDAFLIPHVTGSGVRTKLLESLARRVPTLTNRAGFERIDPALASLGYLHVDDDPDKWVQLITSLQIREERVSSLDLPFPEKLLGSWTLRNVDLQ